MKQHTCFRLICLVMLLSLGCRSAPLTGRKQILLVPEAQEISLGMSAYEQALAEETPSTNAHYVELVNRVGHRISQVSGKPDYQWEFRVIASPEQNAFCLPGGKVAVYEGILPICENEAGLAVVMAHEIAHALARHGGERMSQNYVVNGIGSAISYVNRTHEVTRGEQLMRAYGVASKYGFVLPYSRKHESEADHIGLILMARAGYDPRAAPRFWQRFAVANGSQLPEFLSTHPADTRRASKLLELLPESQLAYQVAAQKLGLGEKIQVAASPAATPASRPPQAASAAAPPAHATASFEEPLPEANPRSENRLRSEPDSENVNPLRR